MRNKNAGFAAAALVLLLLAGCAGAEPAATKSAESRPPPPAIATEETGGIDGLVVDEEQSPIAGANVGLRLEAGEFQTQVVTSKGGAYSISNLVPGPYLLNVSAFGYESKALKLEILAGEILGVTTTLTRVVVVPAMPELTIKKGFINCSFSTPANGGGFYSYNMCRNQANEASQFSLTIDPKRNATEVILELVWQAGVGTGGVGQRLQMWLCSDKDDTTNYMNCIQFVGPNPYAIRTQGPSPLVLRRQDLPFKTVTTFEIDVGDGHFDGTNARVPVTLQQSFDLYITVCYGQLCAPDYQARPV